MKIAFFLPDLRGGGAERAAILLARHWPADSPRPVIILRSSSGHYLADVGDLDIVNLGLPVVGMAATLRTPLALARVARDRSLDIVVTFLTVPSAVAMRLVTRRVRIVWDVQNPHWTGDRDARSWNSPARTAGTRLAVRGLGAVILPSRGLEFDPSVRAFSGPRIYVPNPVDPGILAPVVQSRGREGPFELVAVGRLVRQKRFDVLVEALAEIRNIAPVRLTIYGEGIERAALEALTERLALKDRVTFAGFERDIRKIYSAADAFILSSDFEGFGNVIVEALAFGLPVVSTDAPYGPRDILEDGKYGVLVPCGSARQLARGILSVLPGGENHDLRQVANGRAREYSAPVIADRLRDALQQVPQLPGRWCRRGKRSA